jgi:hypothetical protein
VTIQRWSPRKDGERSVLPAAPLHSAAGRPQKRERYLHGRIGCARNPGGRRLLALSERKTYWQPKGLQRRTLSTAPVTNWQSFPGRPLLAVARRPGYFRRTHLCFGFTCPAVLGNTLDAVSHEGHPMPSPP